MRLDLDIAVIGGGAAGAACATALAQRGASVLLVEADPGGAKVGELLRPSARPVLEALGLDPVRDLAGHAAFTGVRSAWGSAALAEIDFIGNPYGDGWSLNRTRFEAMLRNRAAACGARLLSGAAVVTLVREDGRWRLGFAGGAVERAAFVVDCTGRTARWARRAGARRMAVDRLAGFAAALTVRAPCDRRSASLLVEATESGWWYSAPLPDGRRIVAFLTDADLACAYVAAKRRGMEALARTTTHLQATLDAEAADWAFDPIACSAATSRLEAPAGPAWLAAGDAALSRDPLSGSGLEHALLGGLAAARSCEAMLGGDGTAADAYVRDNDLAWHDMLATRAAVYAREQRWPWSPFWARRHEARARAAA